MIPERLFCVKDKQDLKFSLLPARNIFRHTDYTDFTEKIVHLVFCGRSEHLEIYTHRPRRIQKYMIVGRRIVVDRVI
jgi:hypothetical protein